jgi:hypothetical protein
MLRVLLAADAPDSGWNVTTSVAAVAAGISLVTLIVTTIATGRRERVKWAREALAEAFYAFVDTSYTAATAARKRQEALWDGSADDERSTAAELDRQHSILRNNLTRIRLLAPSRTLQKAQSVRQAHSDLQHALAPDLDQERYHELIMHVARKREELIGSAKRAMGLPR